MSYRTSGKPFTVNTTTTGTQRYGDIAALEGGGTVAVWEDGSVVRAQRLSDTGAKIGAEIAVTAAGDTATKGTPAVAGLEDGGFVVAWYDAGSGVLAQRFDAFGQEVGAELRIDATGGNFLSVPSVTAVLGGGYAVSWQRAQPSTGVSDVFTQLVGSNGAAIGAAVSLTPGSDTTGQFNSATAGLATGGTVTVWQDSDGSLKGQRVGSIGNKIDGVFTVAAGEPARTPSVVALAEGGYVVTWSVASSSGYDVKARLFNDNGTARGADFTVASGGSDGFLSNPDVAASPDGGFTISWQRFNYSGSNGTDVHARSYAADATPEGVAFALNVVKPGDQTYGEIAIDRDGKLVALWTDGTGAALDIKAQVFAPVAPPPVAPTAEARPASAFDAGNTTFVADTHAFSHVDTAVLKDGGYVRLWDEEVGTTEHLYGQRYDRENDPVGDRFTVYSTDNVVLSGIGGVTALENGGFAVAWSLQGPGPLASARTESHTLVYGADGKPIGSPTVSASGGGLLYSPTDVAGLKDGSYVIVSGTSPDISSNTVIFQRHSATGAKLGAAVTVQSIAADGKPYFGDPNVTALTDGGFVVTWTIEVVLGPEQNRAQVFNADGTPRSSVIALTSYDDTNKGWSDAIALANGNFAVAWDTTKGLKAKHFQIYGATGTKVGSELVLESDMGSSPKFTALPDGRFMMTWTTSNQHFGLFFDAAGTKLGEPTLLFETKNLPTEYQNPPTYAALANGDIVASWADAAPTTDFDANGVPVFEDPGTGLPTYTNDLTIQTRTLTFQNPVTGNDGVNVLTGTAGRDRISGLGGGDTLKGLGGDDVLIGGTGGDRLEGGAGIDTASYSTAAAGVRLYLTRISNNTGDAAGDQYSLIERYVGTRFADVMEGDARRNHFDGGLENDALSGSGGADTLIGGLGDDVLDGGTGVDALDGGVGIDAATYAKATSGVTASLRFPSLNTGEAAGDTYRAIEWLIGSNFADTLRGDEARNRLDGGTGADTLFGDFGNDFLFGGSDSDVLDGGAGADRLAGGDGNDLYFVDDAGDSVIEVFFRGGTNDTVTTSVSYALTARQEIEVLRTSDSNALTPIKLTGNDAVTSIFGNAGANTIDGGSGRDSLYGLNGNDTYLVDNADDLVFEKSTSGTRDIVKTSVSYTLKAGVYVEELQTTNDAGRTAIDLTGNEQANTITGNNGNNVLDGGLGKDLLIGDGVTGGIGKDSFLFNDKLGTTNVDRIADFNPLSDTIQLENSGSGLFTKLAQGVLRSNEFKDLGLSGAKVDADDRIIYNRATGILSYDADGSGAAKAVLFAIVNGSPDNMTYKDFLII